MNCPSDVQDALLQILSVSLLNIRGYGWNEDPEQCSIEADHVHNLPGILRGFSVGALRHYWEASRPSFIKQNDGKGLGEFEQPWATIERFLRENEDAQ